MGVTVHNCERGWDSLIHFAQERESQNIAPADIHEAGKKGNRGLKNESCLITYQRNNKDSHRGMVDLAETSKGLRQVNHEDSNLECAWYRGRIKRATVKDVLCNFKVDVLTSLGN